MIVSVDGLALSVAIDSLTLYATSDAAKKAPGMIVVYAVFISPLVD